MQECGELTSICVGPTVCHRQYPSLAVLQVHMVKDLIRELPIWCPIDALATLPCPCRSRENLQTSLSAVLFKLHTGNEGHSSDVYMHTREEYWLLCKAPGRADMRRAARPVGSPPCIMNLQRQQHSLLLQPGADSSYNILRRQQSCKHCRRNGIGSNGACLHS